MSSKSLRSLMKDRQLAKRIQHQFAKYDSAGRLTCTICNCLTVKSEALWPSHLSSKPHRLNYQNYQNSLAANSGTNGGATPMPSKRKTDEMSPNTRLEGDGVQEKKVRFNHPPSEDPAPHPLPKSSLPAGFFDNPALAPTSDDPEGEEQEQQEEEDDPEWSAFKAALEEPSSAEDTSANLFAKASVIAEPVLYDFGKPADALSSQEPGLVDDEEVPNPEEQEEEDPIEKKIREEKEEIMDRIQNEEREQLEADQRVLRMKARVNAFRANRKKSAQSVPS